MIMEKVTTKDITVKIQELRKALKGIIPSEIVSVDRLDSRFTDTFLLSFLYARNFDVKRSNLMAKDFLRSKAIMTKSLSILPSDNEQLFKRTDYGGLLKHPDRQSRPIYVERPGTWDTNLHSLNQMNLRIFIHMIEVSLLEDAQKNGLVVIMDYSEYGWRHLKQVTFRDCKDFIYLVQDSIPLKIKEIHVVFNPRIFNIIYSMSKIFLKEKLKQRLFIHGSNLKTLHEKIEPHILPHHIGGSLSVQDAYDWDIDKKLLKKDEFYQML